MPHYGDDWWMMAIHALSLCETGQLAPSVSLMETSLALNPRNGNAAHFKAHTHYEAGESVTGHAYLTDGLRDHDDRGVLHGHISWYVALWALPDGDEVAMWQVLDAHVAPGSAKGLPINILTDTAALLYRADVAGVGVDPARWGALSDYAAQDFPQTGQSFADSHATRWLGRVIVWQGSPIPPMVSPVTSCSPSPALTLPSRGRIGQRLWLIWCR